MFKDPFGWFPNSFFTNTFPILVIVVFVTDYIIPRLTAAKSDKPIEKSDRGSYIMISAAALIAIALGVSIRVSNIGTASGLFQWLGLIVMVAGLFFREWALIKLGRFFSRTVQIEAGHKIIREGPYRWIRHPAYTGMILVDTGFVMAIGTWLGAMLTMIIITGSVMYRIAVEERTLLRAFGNEYREYMTQTWKLFPGW
jgi:protein-S-isoprenylcysteine O-methyltransferase Ste14